MDRYPNSGGVLLDFSEPMIESAKTKLSIYRNNLVFATIDYGKESWIQSVTSMVPFDVVVSGFSIHHQPDERKRQLYAEIHDLLKPGGLFINICFPASVFSKGNNFRCCSLPSLPACYMLRRLWMFEIAPKQST